MCEKLICTDVLSPTNWIDEYGFAKCPCCGAEIGYHWYFNPGPLRFIMDGWFGCSDCGLAIRWDKNPAPKTKLLLNFFANRKMQAFFKWMDEKGVCCCPECGSYDCGGGIGHGHADLKCNKCGHKTTEYLDTGPAM